MTKISFREDFGYWWPDYDHNPEACIKKVRDHINDMDVPIELCKQRRTVIQAGAHCGLWAERLATRFKDVVTCEPDEDLYECAYKNAAEKYNNITLLPVCFGAEEGSLFYHLHPSAGSGSVSADRSGQGYEVPVRSIDSLKLIDVDLILLDVEGYEIEVLKGALNTIEKCKPVIMLESWKADKETQHAYMKTIGYNFHGKSGRDLVYTYGK